MAGNKGAIDTVVDDKAFINADKLSDKLDQLERQFIDTANAANQLNAATGQATAFRQVIQGANQTAAATLRLQQLQDRAAITANQLTASNLRLANQQQVSAQRANAAATEYQKLVRQYNAATADAREAGVVFGTSSNQFVAAAANANRLRGQLDAIDQPLGNFQRNVGNYGNSIAKVFQKAFGAIRTVANILPGLGLSGAFLLIFEGLKFIVEQFGFFDKAVSAATLTVDAFKEALSAGGEYTKAIQNVSELRENIKLAKEGFLDKNKVVKQFNDTLGKTVGEVGNLNEAEASLNKNAQAFIKFTFLKATAQAALEAAAKKATEAELASVQGGFEGAGTGDKVKAGLAALDIFAAVSAPGTAVDPGKLFLKSEELKKKRVDSAKKQSSDLLKIYDNFQKQAADLSKQNKFDFFQGTEDAKKGADTRKKVLDEQLKQLKQYKDADLAQDNITYDERIAIANKFEVDSIALTDKAGHDGVISRLESANMAREIDAEAEKDRIKTATDAQKELAKIFKDGIKNQEEIVKNSMSVIDQFAKQQTDDAKQSADDQLNILTDQYAKGLISTAEYQNKKKQIEDAAKLNQDQIDINGLKLRIEANRQLGEDTLSDEEKLAEAQRKLDKDTTDQKIANAEKVAEARKNIADLEKQLGQEVFTFAQTLADARYTNELNAIQGQKDAIDDKTKSEIDAENRSLDSSADKADKINIINAKAAAAQAQLDQKSRDIKQKQAQADKIFSIGKVISATALAEAQALTYLSNPFTAPLYPAIAALIAATGAVQLATILATPIPKYEKGTNSAKGGLSIWGEKGTELAIEPSGKTYLSPDSATLANIPKGTKIVPHMELMGAISAGKLNNYAAGEQVPWSAILSELRKGNKPEPKRPNVVNGWMRETKNANKFDSYRKNHFK